MSNIKITDLQPYELEFAELSDLELEAIVGGKGTPDWIKNIEDEIRSAGRSVDDFVNDNIPGGWMTVAEAVLC